MKSLVLALLLLTALPVFAQDKKETDPKDAAIAALGADLLSAQKESVQLRVQLKATQLQLEGVTRTLDASLQADAQVANGVFAQQQTALNERLVKALGGDPAKQMFDFEAKALKSKEEKK